MATDQEVICYGPCRIAAWLQMWFAQRRPAMQSHASADRVPALTGPTRVFRARLMVDAKFIRTIGADHPAAQ